MEILGIDIGGTGIKGAPVNTREGKQMAERHRIPTPAPATPQAVASAVAEIVAHFNWKGPVGCGFPASVQAGVVRTASNIAHEWLGLDAASLFESATGCRFLVLNDADAAGLAEMGYGAGRQETGSVLMVTVGTGLGTALFVDGRLYPNTELGHIRLDCNGKVAERYASKAARKRKKLSWDEWGKRLDEYLRQMERLLWPDLIIIGGGDSRKHEKFFHVLTVGTRIVPAHFQNDAGIVGAAWAAAEREKGRAGIAGP